MTTTTHHFELPRKAVHLLSLFIPMITFYSVFTAQVVIAVFSVFYFFSEWRKMQGHHFLPHRVILKMQRHEELAVWARAPLFLALGVMIAITFYSWEASLIGIYQVGLCDTAAALCGKKWGRTVIPFMTRKTYVGALAFFITALPMAFYFLSPAEAVVIALIGSFLESLPIKDWDNITIPVIVTVVSEQFIFG